MRKSYNLYVGVGNRFMSVEVTREAWINYCSAAEDYGKIERRESKGQNTVYYYLDSPENYECFGYIREVEK